MVQETWPNGFIITIITFISFVLVRTIVAEDNSQLINLIGIFVGFYSAHRNVI